MRQMKPRATTGSRSAATAAGRAKAKQRTPQSRTEWRTYKRSRLPRDDEGVSYLDRVRNFFPFRRPILTLTLSLVVAGTVAGVIAGGHVTKLLTGAESAMEEKFVGIGFAIDGIALAGNQRTTRDAAFAALGVGKGESIFALSPGEARAKLLRLPWVADAEVRRQFPDGVSIRLIEKRPFALWRSANSVVVVERSGAVITAAKADSFPRLPMLAGAGAPQAAAPFIDALGPLKAVSARIQSVERVGERRWDLILNGGVTVKLPEEGWAAQLAELERLIVEKGILERDIEIIDLRYPDNFVFRLHNGDSRPVPRERRA